MKEYTITLRIDNITKAQIDDLTKWIKEEYIFNPTQTEIIRSAIERMHNDFVSKKLYKENK